MNIDIKDNKLLIAIDIRDLKNNVWYDFRQRFMFRGESIYMENPVLGQVESETD